MAAVRIECAIRQHQPDLSGQHRHLLRHVNRCQRIHSHGWSCACRQAWRNPQRHLRSRRMAARRPVEQPRHPQPHLPQSAAPLLTATIVAFDTMPEATFIILKEKPMDISTAATLASGLVALIVPASVQGVQEIHPRRICRTYVPRSVHPVRHHRHRCHRRIRRHLHMGHRTCWSGGCCPNHLYACQPSIWRKTIKQCQDQVIE